MSMTVHNPKGGCTCSRCLAADEKLEELYPKRRVPRFVLAQMSEKRTRQESFDMTQGIMTIQCPKCKHNVKVKIGPKITCTACGAIIQ